MRAVIHFAVLIVTLLLVVGAMVALDRAVSEPAPGGDQTDPAVADAPAAPAQLDQVTTRFVPAVSIDRALDNAPAVERVRVLVAGEHPVLRAAAAEVSEQLAGLSAVRDVAVGDRPEPADWYLTLALARFEYEEGPDAYLELDVQVHAGAYPLPGLLLRGAPWNLPATPFAMTGTCTHRSLPHGRHWHPAVAEELAAAIVAPLAQALRRRPGSPPAWGDLPATSAATSQAATGWWTEGALPLLRRSRVGQAVDEVWFLPAAAPATALDGLKSRFADAGWDLRSPGSRLVAERGPAVVVAAPVTAAWLPAVRSLLGEAFGSDTIEAGVVLRHSVLAADDEMAGLIETALARPGGWRTALLLREWWQPRHLAAARAQLAAVDDHPAAQLALSEELRAAGETAAAREAVGRAWCALRLATHGQAVSRPIAELARELGIDDLRATVDVAAWCRAQGFADLRDPGLSDAVVLQPGQRQVWFARVAGGVKSVCMELGRDPDGTLELRRLDATGSAWNRAAESMPLGERTTHRVLFDPELVARFEIVRPTAAETVRIQVGREAMDRPVPRSGDLRVPGR